MKMCQTKNCNNSTAYQTSDRCVVCKQAILENHEDRKALLLASAHGITNHIKVRGRRFKQDGFSNYSGTHRWIRQDEMIGALDNLVNHNSVGKWKDILAQPKAANNE